MKVAFIFHTKYFVLSHLESTEKWTKLLFNKVVIDLTICIGVPFHLLKKILYEKFPFTHAISIYLLILFL